MSEPRVLVAGPDPIVAGTLTWLLREHGCSAWATSQLRDVVDDARRTGADVVLIDADALPGDGANPLTSLISSLRADPVTQDARVIVAETNSEGARPPTAPTGVDDCVSKPYRVPELLARVGTQLRASQQLRAARAEVAHATSALERARDEADSHRRLVDILHEVTGELSASEIYRILARRVARALDISHCSVVLARAGDVVGIVAAAVEDPSVSNLEIQLERYPEIKAALESGQSVLVDDIRTHPLFATMRARWAEEGRVLEVRSVATLPFATDRLRSGVLFLRTERHERALSQDDLEFADVVIRAAVAAVRRAQALETTRADNRRLEALATTDALTRVLNRRALVDRLGVEVDRARRFESALTLLLLDVDHFKAINDTEGHLAGDSVLRQLGVLLEDAVRKVDVVARYGGEEFVVILPETGMDGGAIFAERLKERIAAQDFDVGESRTVHLTVSIGLATFPSPRVGSMEDLFARADEALYRAKSGGRNQVRS